MKALLILGLAALALCVDTSSRTDLQHRASCTDCDPSIGCRGTDLGTNIRGRRERARASGEAWRKGEKERSQEERAGGPGSGGSAGGESIAPHTALGGQSVWQNRESRRCWRMYTLSLPSDFLTSDSGNHLVPSMPHETSMVPAALKVRASPSCSYEILEEHARKKGEHTIETGRNYALKEKLRYGTNDVYILVGQVEASGSVRTWDPLRISLRGDRDALKLAGRNGVQNEDVTIDRALWAPPRRIGHGRSRELSTFLGPIAHGLDDDRAWRHSKLSVAETGKQS